MARQDGRRGALLIQRRNGATSTTVGRRTGATDTNDNDNGHDNDNDNDHDATSTTTMTPLLIHATIRLGTVQSIHPYKFQSRN
jgi:hypothetical protein